MIDPLSPKKIEPIRLTPESLSDRQVAGAPVGAERMPQGDQVHAHLLDLSASLAAKGPPVDQDRVGELRAAIQSGNYAIEPRQLASAILDFTSGEGSRR